jgi:hypothetical protein
MVMTSIIKAMVFFITLVSCLQMLRSGFVFGALQLSFPLEVPATGGGTGGGHRVGNDFELSAAGG